MCFALHAPITMGGFAQCLPAPASHPQRKNKKRAKKLGRIMEAEQWNGFPTTCCSTNLCCSSTKHLDECKESTTDCGRPIEMSYDALPAIRCMGKDLEHRPKDTPGLLQHMTAMVARPVSRTEMRANEKAMIAAQKEWKRLMGQNGMGRVCRPELV